MADDSSLLGDSLGKACKTPKGPLLSPPSGLRVVKMSVDWDGKDGSVGGGLSTHCSETAIKPKKSHPKGNVRCFDLQEAP